MQSMAIKELVERQRQFFTSGATRPVSFRIAALQRLKKALQTLETELLGSLGKDLHKSEFEAFTSEVGFLYGEITHTLHHLRDWARPRPVVTPLLHQPASSRIYPQPKGVVLIIGPWNYPLMLALSPLIGAIAAGNCAILKPSELAGAAEAILKRLIAEVFPPDYCQVITGGVEATTDLLKERFDHIFFTGSIPVGRIVMRAAAEHLTPVTLELGGKSPCIIDTDVDIEVTARRLAWGKYFNAGQTCVAPDYVLVPPKLKAPLISALKRQLRAFYGVDAKQSADYGRIINRRHFDRLIKLLPANDAGRVVIGGERDPASLYIAPTVIDGVQMDDPLMDDEIFGPLLPLIDCETLDAAMALIRQRANPLACYVFTRNRAVARRVIDEIPFGGGCVNNILVHLANPNLPFGGIGTSGMGAYHGQDSFDTFSHRKGVLHSPLAIDIPVRYPPYKGKMGLMRRLFR